MLEPRRRLGLGAKPPLRLRAREISRGQHLHRDDPPEPPLPRAINHAHAAARDLVEQFVVAEQKVFAAWRKDARRIERLDGKMHETARTRRRRPAAGQRRAALAAKRQ